jgi:uroporphyrinogen-III synthase
VVVTRPRASSDEAAKALRRLGAEVAFAPLIRRLPPRSWGPLDRALARLERYDAVAFASAAAVEALFRRARGRLKSPPPAAAVGPATARALTARGWRPRVVAEDARAEGLARALRLPRGAKVLLPRAERGREALPRLLRAAGAKVDAVTAYRTVPDPAGRRALRRALRAGADAVCFASGSAVAAAGPLGRAAAVAIGPTTAAALRARGVRPAAVADAPTPAALARAVLRALRTS